jgi:hypothetical protein
MPLTKLALRPGINKEGTTYSNEGGYFNCDKVRFRSGYAEKLGGWLKWVEGYKGVAGTIMNWNSLSSEDLLGLGTNQKYYIETGATFRDITPLRTTATGLSGIFDGTNGDLYITVNHTSHGVTAGSFVTYSGVSSTLGGVTMNAEFEVLSVTNANTYLIASPSVLSGSFSAAGGAAITAAYQINAGNTIYSTGVGWGVPGWSSGGWGSATAAGIPPRQWSQDLYGEDLLMAYSYGNIYYWEKNTSTFPRAVTLQYYIDNSAPAAVTLSTSLSDISFASGVTVLTVANTDGIVRGAKVVGTGIPTDTYVAIDWDFSTSVEIVDASESAATTTAVASGTYTFSYGGRNAPDRTEYIVASDTSHFSIALGSKPYDPTNYNPAYDPMLVRWSDQDNPYQWVPSAANQTGEQHLSNGSVLICAQNSRQEILLWSDVAVYSMQYLGPPYVWGFTLIGDNTSIISPNAAIAVNTVTYWMGVDKFYQYNGRLETLSCTIWKYIYDNLNKEQAHQVVCGSNEGYSEIWWFYPSTASIVNDSYVIYNYLDQTWYYGTMNRSAWLDSPLQPSPMGAFGIQTSYLASSISSSATQITLMNGSTYPVAGTVLIDSEYITYTGVNGNILTGCTRGANNVLATPVVPTTAASHLQYAPVTFLVPNQIMYHENGCDDRSLGNSYPLAIESYIESSDFDIGDGNNFGFLWRILPDLTFRGSTGVNPEVTLSVKSRINSGAAYTTAFTDPTNVTRTSAATITPEEYTGQVYIRTRGRQAAFRVDSTEVGTAWQVGAMRIDVRQDGRR